MKPTHIIDGGFYQSHLHFKPHGSPVEWKMFFFFTVIEQGKYNVFSSHEMTLLWSQSFGIYMRKEEN